MRVTPEEIDAASRVVYEVMPPTPQYRWPLLCEHLGTEVWLKHENHTPVGAFKVRGGLCYFRQLAERAARPAGVITATRGNHGQSVAFAARRFGIPCTIVVPHGNSAEKNAAMRSLGAWLIEHGEDFQAAREHAMELAAQRGLHMVPSFDRPLVAGVSTFARELLTAVPQLDVVYVPIGLGSGICGMVSARDALGLATRIVGVVSSDAAAYARSFAARRPVEAPATTRLADGLACRTPEPEALETIWRSVERIVEVSDAEVAAAMRTLFSCTHNASEGAGAAALAAATRERDRLAGLKVGLVLTGSNVDRETFGAILAARDA